MEEHPQDERLEALRESVGAEDGNMISPTAAAEIRTVLDHAHNWMHEDQIPRTDEDRERVITAALDYAHALLEEWI